MRNTVAMLAVLLVVVPAGISGQSVIPARPAPVAQRLVLDDAVRTALQNHPALRQAEAGVEAAEAEVSRVRAAYFPQLSLTAIGKAGLSGATSALALPGFPASPFYRNLAYSANWYQSVFDFGRTKHLVASREALAENARLKKRAEEDRIVLGVRRAYFSALEALKLQDLAEATVRERQLTLKRVEAYFHAGMQSKLEVTLAQANLAEAEGNLVQARNAVHMAFAALRAAMGVENAIEYQLAEPSFGIRSLPSEEELLAAALKNRPDYLALGAKEKAFTEEVGEARSERHPDIRGFGAAGQGRFSGTSVKPNQRHGVGALGIFFPFFTGGRLEAEEREVRAELEGAQASRDLLSQQIRLEVIESRDRLGDLAKGLEISAEQERAAGEGLRLAQARFKAQLASFLELTTAELSFTRAQSNHARQIFDFQRAWADLDFATGQSFKP